MQNNNTPPKLLDQVHDRIRVKHYSIRTEAQNAGWIKGFIQFHVELPGMPPFDYAKRLSCRFVTVNAIRMEWVRRRLFNAFCGKRESVGFNTKSGIVRFFVFQGLLKIFFHSGAKYLLTNNFVQKLP